MSKAYIDFGFGLSGFQEYGFNFLTGEACGYGGRILTDLTPKGADLMDEFLGVKTIRGNGWNDFHLESSSVMMPRGIIADLAVFCLIKDGWDVVVLRDDHVVRGFTMQEWMEQDEDSTPFKDRYLAAYPNSRLYFNDGTAGTRNRHVFSGRTE